MLGNLKEFISVVQDGLSTNNNIRQTLQEVQKMKYLFLEKQRTVVEDKVNYGAGGELLKKYQEDWAEMHRNADINAKAAEEVDRSILEIHELAKYRLQNATDFAQNLAHLPNLTAAVAQCMDSLKTVQGLIKTVEDDLVELEDVFERNKLDKWKLDHHYQLSLYKEKKFGALEDIRCQLAKENTEKNFEREKLQLAELQARRETCDTAFQVDVAKYLVTGALPSGPSKNPDITLDQVQLESDNTDLEKFLES